MIPLLLALQKIAKPGDGLHPELIRVLENAEAEKVPATGTKEIKKQDNLENSTLRRYAVAAIYDANDPKRTCAPAGSYRAFQ